MAVRPIDANALYTVINAWPESIVYKDWVQSAIATAPTLTQPNEWVSVDNKLPKNGVPVLIGNPHWDYPVVASCAGYGVWMDSWHQKMTFTPTCWMPLPERPKEDE